jgi:hypothetical protein
MMHDMIAKALNEIIRQAEAWPIEDQQELAEYAREVFRGPRKIGHTADRDRQHRERQ